MHIVYSSYGFSGEKFLGISSRTGIKRSPSAFAHVTEIARIFEGLED